MANKRTLVPYKGNEGIDLFDERPIDLDGFKLTARAVEVDGRPSLKAWQRALEFASAAHEGSPYWVGDLVAYADTRAEWREKLSQAIAVTRLAEQTLHNLGYISRHIQTPERQLAPTISHAKEVAALPSSEQAEWLGKAATEGWTVREMKLEMRAARRRRVLEGQALLEGMYRVIYADYPWNYSDRQRSSQSGQADHYPGMPIEEGIRLPVEAHALPNAVLFFWVTSSFLYYATDPDHGPDAYRLIRAWGFEPKSSIVWDKADHNWGNYVSVRHEFLIIATRGSCTPDRPTPMFDSVVLERPEPTHSKKPETFRRMIERLYDGPYLELFGRDPVPGWTVFGNDARLWAEQTNAQRASA
jgi:N6-adenosine-specific RNA methylase IME4